MTSTMEGIKISDISLMNPRVRTPGGDPKFHINIKFAGKTTTNTKTEKKRLNGDRVVWDESFSFPGGIVDSFVTFEVFKTHWLATKPVGLLKKKVSDLIQMQNNTGSCKHDIGDKNCQLVFKIGLQSDVLSSVLSETPKPSELSTFEGPANIAGIVLSAHESLSEEEDIWSSFLSNFQIFMNAMDKVADIHPYATFAWGILSVIPKTIMTYKNRNDSVKQLCEKLKETYDFITDAERLPKLSRTQDDVLAKLVQQTIECGYFIRDYSKENIAEKLLDGANIDDHVKGFINKFNHFRKVMTDSIALETSIVTLRVSESVNELREFTLLSEMPRAQDTGFVSGKRCLPGTRQHLIQDIIDWVNQDTPERILVLNGAAGTGKSAVAHTIAEIFRKQNRLGSLFCFNRSYKERRNFLFSTISRELADSDVVWRKSLTTIIEQTSIRTSTDMTVQFEELIVKPSKGISTIGPVVIVIDALDESGDLTERQPLMNILFTQTSVLPSNYRIILTSRPERDIEDQCIESNIPCKRMGDITAAETFSDIQGYISYRLKPIEQVLNKIEGEWRYILAKRAEGLFQWADTACRFINPNIRNPSLIERRWKTCISSSSSSLYQLYHQIISGQEEIQDEQFLNDFKLIVGAILTAREPLSIDALQNIFQSVKLDVKTTLNPFGSLFPGIHDIYTPVRPLHTSLLDFFHERNQDVENENKFYVDTSDHRIFTLRCLQLMNRMLRFNMCNLETSHRQNQDIPDFSSRVKEAIPPHLSYACRFWAFHLRHSSTGDDLFTQICIMMDDNLLYFFEVLGLLGEVDRGRTGMEILEVWCKNTRGELITQIRDAWQFIFEFGEVFSASTPHLYVSALPFTPKSSFVSKKYLPQYPQLVGIEGNYPSNSVVKTGMMKRNASMRLPTSLTFSSVGTYIATGFNNGEFWFWDYEFGEMVYQWGPRQDRQDHIFISDIVFSPDEQLVYCCFGNGLIRIWNPDTKETVEESYEDIFEGKCSTCTISSDGCYIAFVDAGAFLLYDRKTRRKVVQLEYPAIWSFSRPAAFSPNGKRLAFNQEEDVVCLWDIDKQEACADFTCSGHSLSNKYIALRSTYTTEVWDVETISKVNEFETKGSLDCFTSDQYLFTLVYESYSVWNITTGELIMKSSLEFNIRSITLSPDATFIGLGTDDGTVHVRQWDACIQSMASDKVEIETINRTKLWRRGHYLVQHSEVQAPDDLIRISAVTTRNDIVFETQIVNGTPVAVSSRDDVCVGYITTLGLVIWDDERGETILDESERYISSFNFSPDGGFLVSGDLDGVIKIWDSNTHRLFPGPYTVPGQVNAFGFSATGGSFLVAYRTRPSNGISFIEVRELVSERILKGPFKCLEFPNMVAFSADETHIICAARSGIEILDASTGLREFFHSCPEDSGLLPEHTLSPDRNYVVWLPKSDEVTLWHICHDEVPQVMSTNGYIDNFFFSSDSTQLITHTINDGGSINIRDLSTGKVTKEALPIYGDLFLSQLLPLNGNHLVFASQRIPRILNLDLHKVMSVLYDHHQNHSSFGILPVDYLETEEFVNATILFSPLIFTHRSVQAFSGSTSEDRQDLDYALTAWNKSLFSTDTEITADGWMLGPHGELLLWVPYKRRNTLWRPCMVHITAKYFTKLNFDKYVHGSRWTECRANP